MARAGGADHRRVRAAQGTRRRADHGVLRVRPDGPLAALRQPRAARRAAPPPAGRAPRHLPRGRVDRADRRPAAHGRAGAEDQGADRRVGGEHPPPGRAVPGVRRREPRGLRQQPGLDRADVGAGLPARRRQALPGQPDGQEGGHRGAAEQRRGHLLHRVQLPAAAGARLPAALPRLRLHAADRRQRPVGQPHGRLRPDPPGRGRLGAPAHDAAAHRLLGREVRQERGQRHLAVRRDDQPVRLLPVLAQRRGRLGAHPAAGVHRPHPRRAGRARAPGGAGAVPAGGAEAPSPPT